SRIGTDDQCHRLLVLASYGKPIPDSVPGQYGELPPGVLSLGEADAHGGIPPYGDARFLPGTASGRTISLRPFLSDPLDFGETTPTVYFLSRAGADDAFTGVARNSAGRNTAEIHKPEDTISIA